MIRPAVLLTRIAPFDPAHCAGAKAHPSQAEYQPLLDNPSVFSKLWPETFSALDGDELVAIGGSTLVECVSGGWGATVLEGVTGGWVLFTDKITPRRFIAIHRAAVRFLVCFEQINEQIFAHIDPDKPNAVRWAGLLGLEAKRTDVLPDGRRLLRVEADARIS